MTRTMLITLLTLAMMETAAAQGCPEITEEVTCVLGPLGARCDGQAPLRLVEATAAGPLYRLDVSEWPLVQVEAFISQPAGYAFHLANAPTSNGWGGDAGESRFDSEFHVFNTAAYLYANDHRPNQALGTVRVPDPGLFAVTICHGVFAFESPLRSFESSSRSVFQLAGEQRDAEADDWNDTLLWLAIGRTVGSTARVGSGVRSVRVTFGR